MSEKRRQFLRELFSLSAESAERSAGRIDLTIFPTTEGLPTQVPEGVHVLAAPRADLDRLDAEQEAAFRRYQSSLPDPGQR